jgi:methyl-accepting chemotaxis protein
MKGKAKKWRRKQYLIKNIQLKYAIMVGVIMVILLGISQLYTYYSLQAVLPQILSTEIGSRIKSLQITLLLLSCGYIIIMVMATVYITHKMAGPVYRIEEDLKNLSKNPDLSFRFGTRDKDEFKELVTHLNSFMNSLSREILSRESKLKEKEKNDG